MWHGRFYPPPAFAGLGSFPQSDQNLRFSRFFYFLAIDSQLCFHQRKTNPMKSCYCWCTGIYLIVYYEALRSKSFKLMFNYRITDLWNSHSVIKDVPIVEKKNKERRDIYAFEWDGGWQLGICKVATGNKPFKNIKLNSKTFFCQF